MPDQVPAFASTAVDWSDIGYQIAHGVTKRIVESDLPQQVIHTLVEKEAKIQGLVFDVLTETAISFGHLLHKAEAPFLPVLAGFIAPIVQGLFGAEVDEGTFARRMQTGGGAAAGQAIVAGLFRAITGDAAGPIAPGDEGAKRIAGAAVAASLESTFNAIWPELLSDLIPEIGHFTALTELPEGIIRTLGVSRLVRRALGPLVTATCTTPLQWHVNRTYTPELLGASAVALEVARGTWSTEKALEELARQGYNADRASALLSHGLKYHSVGDLDLLLRVQVYDDIRAVEHLRNQGWLEPHAQEELMVERAKRIESFDRSMASTAVDAFAAGRIDEGALGGFCSGVTIDAEQKAQYVELAHARRICNRRGVTPAEAAAAVEAGVLSFIDYRRALERDGRDEEAITVLELMLRAKLDDKKDTAQHRAELEAERAADRKLRELAAVQKKAEHDAKLAAAARGKAGDLEEAAIRGLIPIARVAEVWATDFDAETVGILVALLEDKRAAYVAREAARAKIVKAGQGRGADVGALEAAVLAGVLTLDQFRGRITQLGFTQDDAALLTETLAAKISARDDAKRAHDAAIAAGKVKHVDVATLEVLVRRGHRTMADFDATLTALGFDEGARAALRERLQIAIDDDAAAAAARAAANAALRARGLSWDQVRAAVVRGVKSESDAERFLVDNRFTPDAVATLMAALQADVTEAEAARQRRTEAAARVDAREAPLADVARAARLSIIPVQAYLDRLARDGWTDEAIALETDLLLTEIADVQAARSRRDQLEAASTDRGLTLEQTARAVKAHRAPIEAYTAAARLAGYSDDAANTLTELLRDELAAGDAGAARRQTIAGELAGKPLTLAQLESGVLAGERTIDAFAAAVRSYGYAEDDVALLTALVGRKLAIQTAAAERKGTTAAADAQRELQRATYEAGVLSGLRSLDDYGQWLTAAAYDPDDVALFLTDVQQQIDARGGA